MRTCSWGNVKKYASQKTIRQGRSANNLHEGNVNVVDADVLHVDGEVGHDGEGGAVEEEEGALQGQQIHVWPEVRTLRGG